MGFTTVDRLVMERLIEALKQRFPHETVCGEPFSEKNCNSTKDGDCGPCGDYEYCQPINKFVDELDSLLNLLRSNPVNLK